MSWERPRPLACLPPLLCIGAAVLALMAGAGADPSGKADEPGTGGAWEAVAGLFDGPAEESSPEGFLEDLAARGTEGDVAVAVAWDAPGGLEEAAGEVLGRYRDAPSCELVTSGYLDLHGNVWAALMWHGAGASDIVTVTSGAGGACSVHIVRIDSGGASRMAEEVGDAR